MKLKDLIEIELGKDPEHEKIIKKREKDLWKKIKDEKDLKKDVLKDYEKTMELEKLVPIKALKEKGLRELINFTDYTRKKLKEYLGEKASFDVIDKVLPETMGLLSKGRRFFTNKKKTKMIQQILQELKRDPKIKKEKSLFVLERLFASPQKDVEKYYRKFVGRKELDLEPEDIEKFIDELGEDRTVKGMLANLDKSIDRLYNLWATTKYLSSIKGKGVIEVPPRK